MSFKYQHSADWFSLHSGCSRAAHVAFIYLLPGLSGAQWVPAWGMWISEGLRTAAVGGRSHKIKTSSVFCATL